MKRAIRMMFLALMIATTLAVGLTSTAAASTIEEACENIIHGTWQGEDPRNGVCVLPPGNQFALRAWAVVGDCGNENTFISRPFGDDISWEERVAAQQCWYPYGYCNDLIEGMISEEDALAPCFTDDGQANFDAGACSGSCRVSSDLPNNAADNLPPEALATLYIQVRDDDGNPSDDGYRACFANPEGDALTIYRFVSGEWRALATSNGDPICADASSDGAFYLSLAE